MFPSAFGQAFFAKPIDVVFQLLRGVERQALAPVDLV